MTCLETLLTREQATLRRGATTLRAEHRQAQPAPPPKLLVSEQQRSARQARRYARSQQVVHLKAQGWSQRAIAQETGLHPQTVAIYLKAGQFPERAPTLPAHVRSSRILSICKSDGSRGSTMDAFCSRKSGHKGIQQDSPRRISPFSPGAHMGQQPAWLARRRCTSIRHILPSKRCGSSSKSTERLQKSASSSACWSRVNSLPKRMSLCADSARSSPTTMRRLCNPRHTKPRRLRFLSSSVSSRGCVWIGKPWKMHCCLPAVKDRSKVR
jgi:Homeodomain-like domain